MKLNNAIWATGLLTVLLTVPTSPVLAEDLVAGAVLGGTPFAITNYGPNVVKGRAVLVSDKLSNSSQVVVQLSGLKPGTAHIGHIHGGTCAALQPGAIFHNLKPVVADASGKGTSKTQISKGLQGLVDCEWWVAFHEGPENTSPQTPALAVGPVITKPTD